MIYYIPHVSCDIIVTADRENKARIFLMRLLNRGQRRDKSVTIENLTNNAAKYGFVGAPITLTLSRNKNVVLISIHNEGIPISPDDHSKIFEHFNRAEISKSHHKGRGIGLTLVREFAKAHGGEVSMNSSSKLGTEFTVSLPLDSRNL